MLQKAIHKICHVGVDKRLEIDVPEELGDEVEIIILPYTSNRPIDTESVEMMSMQEKTGFVTSVLEDEAEDVWNDL